MSEPKYTDDDLKRVAGFKDEQFDNVLTTIQENIESLIAPLDQKVGRIERDVAELKSDMKLVKAAVTDNGRQIKDHEHRISRLEANA